MRNLFLWLLFFIMSSLQIASAVNDTQKDGFEINHLPMSIVADSWSFDNTTGISDYEGNVKIDQGTAHLTADRVITHRNNQHQIDLATAYGLQRPAEYITHPPNQSVGLHAIADVIQLTPLTSIVTLKGHVSVQQGDNHFQGPLLIYHMKNQTVNAPASKEGRSTIIITPKQ